MTSGAGQDHDGPTSIDDAVRALLEGGATAALISERLLAVGGVTAARVRSGLVKTEPPIVELEVDRGADGTRVYDLAQHADGSLHWVGAHDA